MGKNLASAAREEREWVFFLLLGRGGSAHRDQKQGKRFHIISEE